MKGKILTIGSFDGVHRGHAALLDRAVLEAKRRGLKSAAVTFRVPPKIVLNPNDAHEVLSDRWEKEVLIREQGIDEIHFLEFDEKIAQTRPFRFFKEILINQLKAKGIVIGSNFRFGFHRGAGALELVMWGQEFGIPVWVIDSVKDAGSIISSSKIRELLKVNRFEKISRYLGHPFLIGGPVISGRGMGKKMGVPTLNLAAKSKALPRGVFVVKGWSSPLGQKKEPKLTKASPPKRFFGVCNIGSRPTFLKNSPVTVEVHILEGLDMAQKPYLFIELIKKLRNEKRFPSKDCLLKAVHRDMDRAAKFISENVKTI